MTLELRGKIPSKKNNYRRGKSGGLYLDRTAADQIAPLLLQAQALWKREPLVDPDMTIQFTTSEVRQDRDGLLVTCLDLLQKAGVIRNDNIRRFNGTITLFPAVICKRGEEKVRIVFSERVVSAA